MGTGKTTVGKEIARLLDRTFWDTDEIIEKEQNRTISGIFKTEGEGYFRDLERRVVADIYNKNDIVIATGGGTLLDKDNLNLLSKTGIIFCLTANIDILFSRLNNSLTRPLIAAKGNNNIEKLYEMRKNGYAKLPNHVDTSDKSPADTAKTIIRLFNEITNKTRVSK
jgi:shikimate kinase